jgi:excisionase family DNA binding protein
LVSQRPQVSGGICALANHEDPMSDPDLVPTMLNVLEAAKIAGVGRSSIYAAMANGSLNAKKLGRRTIITSQALQEFIGGLPDYKPCRFLAANDNAATARASVELVMTPRRTKRAA